MMQKPYNKSGGVVCPRSRASYRRCMRLLFVRSRVLYNSFLCLSVDGKGLMQSAGQRPSKLRIAVLACTVLSLAGLFYYGDEHLPRVCLARSIIGIPCPGCGTLTALHLLAEGSLEAAHTSQPVVLMVAAWLFFYVAHLIAGWQWCAVAASHLGFTSGISLIVVWLARLIGKSI